MTPAAPTFPPSDIPSLPPPRREGHLVAAILGTRAAAFELGTAHEVFGLDRSEYANPWYRFRVIGAVDSTVPVTDGDWFVSTPYTLDDLDDVDTVILPVWPGRGNPAPPELIDALRAVHARGGRLVSVCTGAYLLAQAGLLDGRRATTHWMYADDFASRYPEVEVDRDVLCVDAGDGIYTSAGTAAGIDLCLHIVRLDHGAEVANKVARRMVVPPQRDGGQAQFVDAPVPTLPADDPIGRTLDWVMAHLDEPMTVDDLASRAHAQPAQLRPAFPGGHRHHADAVAAAPAGAARPAAARDERPAGRPGGRAVRVRHRDGPAGPLPPGRRHHARRPTGARSGPRARWWRCTAGPSAVPRRRRVHAATRRRQLTGPVRVVGLLRGLKPGSGNSGSPLGCS